ncbi:palmitoyltransferase for Vac8p [Vermiconidia calcicola]|uniref:Palmitoyltransferase for Vac8p n=1 Tax=Vermiconidia calcicola TaxID=1690605 RepID=A0ACC3MDT9_9PEZI|nr:palmitoyltransferase for Vac8p [Vermiconidia calcicola]
MATLAAPDSPPMSPSFNFRRKSWARRLERCCCNTLAYFPLTFVYGLSTWAIYVEVNCSFLATDGEWQAWLKAGLGVFLYTMANTSYTIAVFTRAGSPLDTRQDWSHNRSTGYENLPIHEPSPTPNITTLTAKSSTGAPRYCKKCHTTKPDRTHHCSTCGHCVLKMDHHCPWLATCVGLHNYKPFILFLLYTSVFCWLCFGVSAHWVWFAIADQQQVQEQGLRVVNTILLAVLGGIIGLVLSGFAGWHVWLATSGQTTIESLEKTRYLSPVKKSMEQQLQQQSERHYLGQEEWGEEEGDEEEGQEQQSLLSQLKETHANALPGVLRPEEGESPSRSPQPSFSHSPAKISLYANLEAQRERDRYTSYLDELDSEKLPHAFDLGPKRNLLHVFGHNPVFWALPVCNTSGDGWVWEVSAEWQEAREELERERVARAREEAMWEREGRGGVPQPPSQANLRWMPGQGFVDRPLPASGAAEAGSARGMQMQPLDRRKAPPSSGRPTPLRQSSDGVDSYDTSSDEGSEHRQARGHRPQGGSAMANWNDIPDDFLSASGKGKGADTGSRSRSRGRRKGD